MIFDLIKLEDNLQTYTSQTDWLTAYCLAVNNGLKVMLLVELSLNNYSILSDRLIDTVILNLHNLHIDSILAQSVKDPDVLGQMVDGWNNFVKSGQGWALLLGFCLGYLLRGITA